MLITTSTKDSACKCVGEAFQQDHDSADHADFEDQQLSEVDFSPSRPWSSARLAECDFLGSQGLPPKYLIRSEILRHLPPMEGWDTLAQTR